MRVCDATVEILNETDNDAVMWGNYTLLHMIAGRLGWEPQAWRTEKRVLDALSKTPGILKPVFTRVNIHGRTRLVRCFRMPEENHARST